MANTASAEKRERQRQRHRVRNLLHLTTTRTMVKRARAALEQKDAAAAKEQVYLASKQLAKAAQRGVIPKRTASRKISRLNLALNKLSAPATKS